mgnify:CR=1 FL=1
MRRSITLTVLVVGLMGTIAGGQPSGFSVPLAQPSSMYEGRDEVTFAVKECRGLGAFGGFQPGEILQAAQSAAAIWNESFPRVRINAVRGDCGTRPVTNNGENELYWTGKAMPAERFGLYIGMTQGARLIEEDIQLKADNIEWIAGELDASPQQILVNAIVHEYGHALGLADAYVNWPKACGWSVMLALCSADPVGPTGADLQALRSIYGSSSDDDALAPPPSGSSASLRQFDANDNRYIDDAELSNAMDQWLAGRISDDLLFQVIDAWTSRAKLQGASLEQAQRFSVTSVTLFNLSGDRVGQSACSSDAALDRAHRILKRHPQGTYIARVRDCQTGANKTEKLAHLR